VRDAGRIPESRQTSLAASRRPGVNWLASEGLSGLPTGGSILAPCRRVTHESDRPPRLAPRLLILIDDEAILLPINHYLRGRGHLVVMASEAEEAEALLDHEPFDVLVLDLALSRFGRNGLDALRSIRAAHPWLPVAVISADGGPEVEQDAARLGADAVLVGPQPLAELARVVETLVAARK
jgi:CheY-like chemotaxis protein